jgi:hypothetical protein
MPFFRLNIPDEEINEVLGGQSLDKLMRNKKSSQKLRISEGWEESRESISISSVDLE